MERLPGSLIGKRIIDGEPACCVTCSPECGSITADKGYEKIVSIIEDAHGYLRDAKLEQAFDQAIFKGRRRVDQTLSGFVATKKAAFQGNCSEDQRQRIQVLTDGSIDFPKVEKAIRKLFGETVDDSAYYGDQVCYGDQGYGDEPDLFEDLLEFDEAHGDIYMCLDEPLPAMLDEDEAVSCAGELLSFVYGTASERWSKGKGKMQWQGPTVLWERLWCVRHVCGIQEGSSRCPDQPWPVPQLPATGPLAQRLSSEASCADATKSATRWWTADIRQPIGRSVYELVLHGCSEPTDG